MNVRRLRATSRVCRELGLNGIQAGPPEFSATCPLQAPRPSPLTPDFNRGIFFLLPLGVFSVLTGLVRVDKASDLRMAVLVGNRSLDTRMTFSESQDTSCACSPDGRWL